MFVQKRLEIIIKTNVINVLTWSITRENLSFEKQYNSLDLTATVRLKRSATLRLDTQS